MEPSERTRRRLLLIKLFLMMAALLSSICCLNIMMPMQVSERVTEEQHENLEICFPTSGIYQEYHPPEFPPEKSADIIFNVSIGQQMLLPIVAFLCRNGRIINDSDPLITENQLSYTISSIPLDEFVEHHGKDVILCQHASNRYPIYDPRRYDLDPLYSKKICSTKSENGILSLPPLPLIGNALIAQGLYHNYSEDIQIFPIENLVYFIEFSMNISDKVLRKRTNAVEVNVAIATLRWVDYPETIKANEPFNLSLEIVDDFGRRIDKGLESTLLIEVTVAHHKKYFFNETDVEDLLFETSVTLTGYEVITSLRNQDLVLHKRVDGGFVNFTDVRILDISDLILNATLIVPRTGIRQPNEYFDVTETCRICNKINPCKNHYTFDHVNCGSSTTSRAVKFSRPITVIAQEATILKLIQMQKLNDPVMRKATLASHHRMQWLWVEVQDAEGRRIFSGPDADLEITTKTEPPTCILEGTFYTHRGLGHFHGAFCEIKNVRIYFITNITRKGLILQTEKSDEWVITGTFKLAYFGSFQTAGHLNDPDPNSATFAKFAAEDIRAGMYSKELQYSSRRCWLWL